MILGSFLGMRAGLMWEMVDTAGCGERRGVDAGAPPQPRVGDTITYVYSFMGKARSHGGALFFGVTEEDGEFLDGGHGDVSAVVSG